MERTGPSFRLFAKHKYFLITYRANLFTENSFIQITGFCFQVWPSNSTGDLLDSLDDLLASGDASAALFVLDIVAGGLGGDESVNIGITVM